MGHAPLSNLYESVVFFAWTIILIFAFVDFKYRYRIIGALWSLLHCSAWPGRSWG